MSIQNTLLLMDDDERRLKAMNSFFSESDYEVALFDNAPDTIQFLKHNLSSVRLISLDHDLGTGRERNGEIFDPGTGRDVVDYLVTQIPACPVILHTSNYTAREGMIFTLERFGWKTSYVRPYNDLEWIGDVWRIEVEKYLGKKI